MISSAAGPSPPTSLGGLDQSLAAQVDQSQTGGNKADGRVRFNTVALTSMAMAAMLLAAVGMFALMAYVVQQRAPEIGVRLAVGATPEQIRRRMLAEGMRLVLGGVALGWLGAGGLSRTLTRSLFRVESFDTRAFLAGPVLLVIAGLLAV